MLTRLRLQFGLSTLTAAVIAVLLWWSGALKQPEPPTDLRVVYEADRAGKLRRAEAPTAPAPLVIREPRMLLQHANALQLTPPQRTRIQRIVAEWEKERSNWLRQLRAEQMRAESQILPRKGDTVPYPALRQGLQQYSELSHAYSQARHLAWQRAITQLSAEQRENIQRVLSKR